MKAPLVSLGLPVYNAEQFLPECLDSLLAQTHTNLEIIISDNASTDGTLSLCESYVARDQRIRVVRGESNRGSAWNHNKVVELTRGEYFRWCGADDVIAPRFIEVCLQALTVRPDAVLAFPLTVVIDDGGTEIARTSDRMPLASTDATVRFGALLRAWRATHSPFYGLIRRSCLTRARPLGAFLANDRCLLTELSLMGPFLQVEEYLMYRRQHTEHASRDRQAEQRMYVPDDRSGFRARELVVLRENLTSVGRASLDVKYKLRLIYAAALWVIHQRSVFIDECKGIAYEIVHGALNALHT